MKKSLLVALTAMGLGMGLTATASGIPTACYASCDAAYVKCMKTFGKSDPFYCGSGRYMCQERCLNSGGEEM